MRGFVLAILFAATACGTPPTARRDSTPIAFDGAAASSPATRRAHGERLTRVLGCRGCHGPDLQGHRFYELYASNLTREVSRYSDAQFERVLRHGERIDGRDLWAMPSEIFQYLSDADFAALIAYLRTLPPAGGPALPRLPWEPETERMIRTGVYKPAARTVLEARAHVPVDLGPQHAFGRYIAMVTCAECHGPELRGEPGGDAPNLVIASGYDRDQFERLLTTGVPIGGRTLHLMAEVARGRFAFMTRHERDAVYAYLQARAARAQ